MAAITVSYVDFPPVGSLPVGVPHFHTPEAFRAYVRLYWAYRKYQELDIQQSAGLEPLPLSSQQT